MYTYKCLHLEPKRGQKAVNVSAYHNLSVPQYILIASRVQYDTTGVGVNTVDMQNT